MERQPSNAASLVRFQDAPQGCVWSIVALDSRPPQTMRETFDVLVREGYLSPKLGTRMKKAIGFRNIAIHNYEAIDWAIVHSLCSRNLDDCTSFAREIARRL
ncbi:MAG: DUF86 domain-containing protein [Gammaproteobacteria bacterium]|nr:DUF86 domain-containing protein [Gammaproteobacteria bacterium]